MPVPDSLSSRLFSTVETFGIGQFIGNTFFPGLISRATVPSAPPHSNQPLLCSADTGCFSPQEPFHLSVLHLESSSHTCACPLLLSFRSRNVTSLKPPCLPAQPNDKTTLSAPAFLPHVKPSSLIRRPPSLMSHLTHLVHYVTPVPTTLTGDNFVTANRDDDGQFHFTMKDTDSEKLERDIAQPGDSSWTWILGRYEHYLPRPGARH